MNHMFTDRVKKVLQYAREESSRLGHDYIGTEHLLLGLVKEGQGVAVAVLANLGIQLEALKKSIEECMKLYVNLTRWVNPFFVRAYLTLFIGPFVIFI